MPETKEINQELVSETIAFLNRLLRLDHNFMDALFDHRVACNKALAEHPQVIVWADSEDGPYSCRILGLLNGLLQHFSGVDNLAGPICMYVDDKTKKIIKFARWQPPKTDSAVE